MPYGLHFLNFKMNSVDYLLQKCFSSHALHEKTEIKLSWRHRPKDVVITGKGGKNQNRKFSDHWFDKAP